MRGCQCRLNESGASVIIGTLMLILVVVIGAAGIALMMSTAQKDEMNRQAHTSAVKNEKLDINDIRLIQNGTTPDRWLYVNFTIVNLDINDATVTVIGLYDQTASSYRYPDNLSAGPAPDQMQLFDLKKTNSAPLYMGVEDSSSLRIPGKKSLYVSISLDNFTDIKPRLSKNDEIRVILYTLLYNNFEKRFIPPTPMMKVTVESEDLGVTKRDYLLLDGTGSTDDGAITRWNWTVTDGGSAQYYEGKTVQARFTSTGPFTVNLTVTDDTLMKGTSHDYMVPANPRFNPPASLAVNTTLYPLIIARVTSIDGASVGSAPVDFLLDANPFGNITLSSYSAMTDVLGNATTSVSGGPGRIRVVSGNLPPVYVPVS